jgi:tyrocidine synthetase III
MVLLSIVNIWLSGLSGETDILVGTPVGNRRHSDLENIVGVFVNTLVMRNCPAPDKPYTAFLQEVKKRCLAVFEQQEYPIEELAAHLASGGN